MSKFRREHGSCLYVISDIHGMYKELQIILKRILPLRKTTGYNDKLIFLGDYIDRKINSHKVIDLVMEVKNDHQEQVVCLKGNHELMILNNLSGNCTLEEYELWMKNGGEATMLGYLEKAGSDIRNPYLIPRKNLIDFIPREHIDFYNSLLPYYETDEYIFVHGGCDPTKPLNTQVCEHMVWDHSVFQLVFKFRLFKNKCPWKKTVVTGHNGLKSGKVFIYDKFMMLDTSYAEKVCVCELNSRTGYIAKQNKKRLVKIPIK